MNTSPKRNLPKRSLKPIVVALALALPCSAALAASMDDVVKTRVDQNIDQQYGRDSVYAFSPQSKPLSPERTSGPHWFQRWFHRDQQAAAGANESYRADGYPDSQMQANVGSGYTGSEKVAVGSGYTNSEDILAQADIGYTDTEMASDVGSGYTGGDTMAKVGSGYTGSEEIVSEAGTEAALLIEPTSELALAGEAQGDWEGEYAVIIPLDTEMMLEPSTSEDGTATQFDRGYYRDPDQVAMLVIIPDSATMEEEPSASADEESSSVVAD